MGLLLDKNFGRIWYQTIVVRGVGSVVGSLMILFSSNGLCESIQNSRSSVRTKIELKALQGKRLDLPPARVVSQIVDGRMQIMRTDHDQAGPITVITGFSCVDTPEACMYINSRRFNKAALVFRAKMLEEVKLAEIKCGWANALFLEGKLEEAARAYALAAEDFPHHPDIRVGLGNIYIRFHQLGRAKKVFGMLVKEPGYAAIAHNNLGNAYRLMNRFPEALAEYEQAIQEDPGLMAAEYNRAGVLLALMRFEEAARAFRSATQGLSSFADAYLYEGLAHLRAEHSIPAVVALYRALELGIDDQVVHLALGVAFQSLDLDRKAVVHLRRAKELGQKDQKIYELLSTSLVRLGKLDQAARVMLEAFALGPQNAEAHFLIGLKLFLCEQYSRAANYLLKAANLGRRKADTYFILGQALLESGDIESSVKALLLASKLSPYAAEIHFSLGIALVHQGELVQAIREIEAAAALNPLDIDTQVVLMDLLRRTANFKACARTGRLMVERHPKLVSPRFETAYCQAMAGDLDRATKMLEDAMDQDIEGSKVHKVWRRLIEQTSKQSEVPGMYLLLGMIQERRGDWKDAIHSYRRFISLSPSKHWTRRIFETILRLNPFYQKSDPVFSDVP